MYKQSIVKTFIEYLQEKRVLDKNGKLDYFLLPKNITRSDKQKVDEVIDCLLTCLKELKSNPSDFTISNRDVNKPTIEHIFNCTLNNCNSTDIKKDVIDYILGLPLKQSFSKSEKSKSKNPKFSGWVYVFVVKNAFNPELSVVDDFSGKERYGSMLYLKFNFRSYVDANDSIKIDPKSLVLDVISIHPTNHF